MNEKGEKTKKQVKTAKNKNKRLFIVLILIILVAVGSLVIHKKMEKPEMELVGESEINLNLDEKYEEKGAIAKVSGREVEVETVGEVNTQVPGEYIIKYTSKNSASGRTETIERKIIVHDNIAPTIELKGEERITILEDGKYEEKGVTANDNIDGDISSQVEIKGDIDTSKAGEYELEYVISDKAGNKAAI